MAIDYSHEQAAVQRYVLQRTEGLTRAAGESLPRLDHTYLMRAARGELAGAPPTGLSFRNTEPGRERKELSDLLGKSSATYLAIGSGRGEIIYGGVSAKRSSGAYSSAGVSTYSSAGVSAYSGAGVGTYSEVTVNAVDGSGYS